MYSTDRFSRCTMKAQRRQPTDDGVCQKLEDLINNDDRERDEHYGQPFFSIQWYDDEEMLQGDQRA